MELNVWTSSKVAKLQKTDEGWVVDVKRGDNPVRKFKPRHIIFAHGLGGGLPNFPVIPGMVRRF